MIGLSHYHFFDLAFDLDYVNFLEPLYEAVLDQSQEWLVWFSVC